jgi:hypothetical protein
MMQAVVGVLKVYYIKKTNTICTKITTSCRMKKKGYLIPKWRVGPSHISAHLTLSCSATTHWLLISIISLEKITSTEGDVKTPTLVGVLSVAGTVAWPLANWLVNSFSMMQEIMCM